MVGGRAHYDGDGVRFSRQVGTGPVTRYVSDVNTSLPVTIDDGTRKYVFGLGLAYAVSGTAIEVYHTDRLGSVRAVSDATGAVTATYRTDEFGITTATTGSSSQPFTYTGEPRDATGLSYLRARYYDPTLGRFMSRDPFAGFASGPLSLNRYTYARSNPSTLRDPSGRNPCLGTAGAGAAIGGTAGSVFPGAGTAAGAAGGGLVGFLACSAAVVVTVVILEGVLDQKEGDVIPQVSQPLISVPNPLGPPEQREPGKDPFRSLRGWAKAVGLTVVVSIILKALSGKNTRGEPLVEAEDIPPTRTLKPQVLRAPPRP